MPRKARSAFLILLLLGNEIVTCHTKVVNARRLRDNDSTGLPWRFEANENDIASAPTFITWLRGTFLLARLIEVAGAALHKHDLVSSLRHRLGNACSPVRRLGKDRKVQDSTSIGDSVATWKGQGLGWTGQSGQSEGDPGQSQECLPGAGKIWKKLSRTGSWASLAGSQDLEATDEKAKQKQDADHGKIRKKGPLSVGMLAVMMSALLFGVVACMVKSVNLPPYVQLQVRYTIQWVLSLTSVTLFGSRVKHPGRGPHLSLGLLFGPKRVLHWMLLRALIYWFFMVMWWSALTMLPVGDATALVCITPVFSVPSAMLFLKERVRWTFFCVPAAEHLRRCPHH